MATRTIRVYWPEQVSHWVNFNWNGVINSQSVVHIAACEGALGQPTFETLTTIERTRGDATIYVKNVHPHDGGVEFFLQVDWPKPLNVVVDISVLDPPETGFIV